MASADLVLAATRRDADTTPAADGGNHSLYTNAIGRLKVSAQPGAFDATSQNITANAQSVPVEVNRASNITVHLKGGGTAGAGGNFTFEASVDSTTGTDGTWFGIQMVRTNANTIETATGVIALAVNTGNAYAWEGSVNAYNWFRVRTTAFTSGIYVVTAIRGAYATEPIPAIQTHGITGTVTTSLTSTTLTAVTPGTAATNLGKAEDAVHASGDVGVAVWSVRNDNAATTPASANADYQQISTNTVGGVFVQDTPTTTPTISRVATSATSASLAASAAARRALLIYNESASTLYVKFGATASATSYTVAVPANQYYEVPAFYTGAVDGILASGTGNAQITSLV